MKEGYYKFSTYLKERFGTSVHKVSVDAGFSCPNRDGTISKDGCIYCDNKAFSFQNRSSKHLSLREQISQGIESAKKRFKAKKFIVYFQAHTNTYASLDVLKERYDVIRNFDDVVGLSIATRPDCVNKEILELIASYADAHEVWLEYGLQTIHDKTLGFINRGHIYEDFLKAVELTRNYNIKICAHVIIGLPGETKDMMMATAKELGRLKIDGVKIHPLHVVKGTKMEEIFCRGEYLPLELDEYANILSEFLSYLWPKTVVHRITASCPKEFLVAPSWIAGPKERLLSRPACR